GGGGVAVVHKDNAATKLSDRVRRWCFNVSGQFDSNISPPKTHPSLRCLCNKCGLFERMHSRPRPELSPHKRGPL
ncbi:hypothetical protein B0H16DRAFT_1225350, partial [Mycena metata]